eukprot:2384413-Prymnesium_polylepis.1
MARAAPPTPVGAHPAACEQPQPTTPPHLARTRVGSPEDAMGDRGELQGGHRKSWRSAEDRGGV